MTFVRARTDRGFSLIEITIAVALTLIVMAGVFGLLQRGQASFRREPEITDLNQSARNGLDMMARDLTLAGYKTPATTAILWANGGGLNPDQITIVYSDPDVPTAEPVKCGGAGGGGGQAGGGGGQGGGGQGGGGPCNTIGQSSVLNVDPNTMDPRLDDPTQAYKNGQILFAFETADCNGDGQIGMIPFQLTQPPRMTNAGGTDTLNLNHNPSGNAGLNPPGGFNGEVHPDCAIIGVFRVIQYRVNPLPPTPNPNLERRDLSLAEPWIAVSRNIENLQIQYAVGTGNVFVDVPAQPTSDPATWINRVQVTIGGRTESLNLEGGSQGVFQASDTHVRRSFSTTVSLRNIFFASAQASSGGTYN
jgi:prepilin-type N-terminal cleavage/methylation domain-containing protein